MAETRRGALQEESATYLSANSVRSFLLKQVGRKTPGKTSLALSIMLCYTLCDPRFTVAHIFFLGAGVPCKCDSLTIFHSFCMQLSKRMSLLIGLTN